MGEGRLELFDVYSERGFDGKYERTTSYRLIVGEGNRNASVTLEIEVETRTVPDDYKQESLTKYQIGAEALVELIKKEGTRADG